MRIEVEKKCSCTPDDIFSAIRDGNDLPKYWHGMREIKPIGGEKFEVRFQFPGKSIMEYSCDPQKKQCEERYISGSFKGLKVTSVRNDGDGSIIQSHWDINLSPVLRIMGRRIMDHFREGTEHALDRMCASVISRNTNKGGDRD